MSPASWDGDLHQVFLKVPEAHGTGRVLPLPPCPGSEGREWEGPPQGRGLEGRGTGSGAVGDPGSLPPRPTPPISDLLLPLLLALGATAALWAGEARTRVHALLRVPRHALLQRQGGLLTRAPAPPNLPGLPRTPREEGPLAAGGSPRASSSCCCRGRGLQATQTCRTASASVPPTLAPHLCPPPRPVDQQQGPAGARLQAVGVSQVAG